jgi:hypothetical protein
VARTNVLAEHFEKAGNMFRGTNNTHDRKLFSTSIEYLFVGLFSGLQGDAILRIKVLQIISLLSKVQNKHGYKRLITGI